VLNELITKSALLVTKQVVSSGGSIEGGPDSFTHASAIALHIDSFPCNSNELRYVDAITTSDHRCNFISVCNVVTNKYIKPVSICMSLEMTISSNESKEISPAILDRVLNTIGQDPKRTLLQYLQRNYGISMEKASISCIHLENALYGLIGSGAQIILQLVETEIACSRSK